MWQVLLLKGRKLAVSAKHTTKLFLESHSDKHMKISGTLEVKSLLSHQALNQQAANALCSVSLTMLSALVSILLTLTKIGINLLCYNEV